MSHKHIIHISSSQVVSNLGISLMMDLVIVTSSKLSSVIGASKKLRIHGPQRLKHISRLGLSLQKSHQNTILDTPSELRKCHCDLKNI